MDTELYLIHGDDYLSHIDDKVDIYDLLTSMAREAREQIATGHYAAALRVLAKYEKEAIEVFETWGIPESYLETGDEEELAELMENELLPPTDGCCGDAPCCLVAEGYEKPEDEDTEDGGGDGRSVSAKPLEFASTLTETARLTLDLCACMMDVEFSDEV